MRKTRLALLVLGAAVAVQLLYYYPRLPDRIACHFNASGVPDGWMPKGGFVIVFLLLLGFVTALLYGIGFIIRSMPDRYINLPRKQEWLAPEHRARTLDWIQRQMEWMAVGTLALLVGVLQVTMHANMQPAPRLPLVPVWVGLGLYTTFVTAWSVRFLTHFSSGPRVVDPAPHL